MIGRMVALRRYVAICVRTLVCPWHVGENTKCLRVWGGSAWASRTTYGWTSLPLNRGNSFKMA